MNHVDTLGALKTADWPSCPTARLLSGTDFRRALFEPAMRPTYDARVAVAFQPFRWADDAPWTWLFATVGLAALTQERRAAPVARVARAAPHIELCMAMREPDQPALRSLRAAWNAGALADAREVPSILSTFATVAQNVASWIVQDRDVFTFGDHVENACLAKDFPSALLIPPIGELLHCGLTPFNADGVGADIELGRWADRELLLASGDHLFLQVAPLRADEYQAAKWGGFRFFLNALLATDAELERGEDASAHIIDLHRASRAALG